MPTASDEAQRAALAREFPEAICSRRASRDVAALRARIVAFFEQGMVEAEFVVPYREQRHVALLHERCRVLEERYERHSKGVRENVARAGRNRKAVLGATRRSRVWLGD